MIIRKQFKFNNMHIVRNCSSERCKKSLHAHSYQIEVLLKAKGFDNGQMLMDFGLFKGSIGQFISAFNNSYTAWSAEPLDYKDLLQEQYERYIEMPISPSAESLSLMFFFVIDKIIKNTQFNNGEKEPELYSIRVHETLTGWAESFREDLEWWNYELSDIYLNDGVTEAWKDPELYDKLIKGIPFINPVVTQQIKLDSPIQFELV